MFLTIRSASLLLFSCKEADDLLSLSFCLSASSGQSTYVNLSKAVNVIQKRPRGVIDKGFRYCLVGHPRQNLLLGPQADIARLERYLCVCHDWNEEGAVSD